MRRPRQESDSRKRRLVIVAGVLILTAIIGIPLFGWYSSFFRPPRVKAATVGDTVFTQGDLVKRIRVLQAAQGYQRQAVDLSRAPFVILFNPDVEVSLGPFNLGMVQLELLKQAAPNYGVQVTKAEIDETIRLQFTPKVPEGQQASPDQIEREYKEAYRNFLNFTGLSDGDYRQLLSERLYFEKMHDALGKNVPTETEHVEVSWIELPNRPDPNQGPEAEKFQNVPALQERLKTEDFAKVAQAYSSVFKYPDSNGYVGWVPRGAFPALDKTLFGGVGAGPIAHGQVSAPIFGKSFTYLVKVTAGPEVRQLEEKFKRKLQDETLQSWMDKEFERGTSEKWVKLNYNSKIHEWVQKQLAQSARKERGTPQPAQGLGG